jgi:hypothetical protein
MIATRSRCAGWMLAALMVMSTGLSVAQNAPSAVDDAAQLAATSYDSALRAAESSAAPQSPLSEEDAKRYHEFRIQLERDKVVFAVLLAVTALLAHFVVLRSLPRTDRNSANIVSATGLVYIVFGTIILVVIASTDQQLTASMGILGAVAGYLFGKHRGESDEAREQPGPAPGARREPA